jgi:AcrR family transcriptional regulator
MMRSTERRADALSRRRIVEAAVAMLDTSGEGGLTFRALAAQLRTGAGAIYWHVPNKSALLVAATEAVLTATEPDAATPEDVIRAVALGVFDAVEAHPWVGAQLSRLPSQKATLRVFERLGRQLQALGVPVDDQFNSASALLNYILGIAAQNAALARQVPAGTNRTAFLANVSADLDADDFAFTRSVAGQLRDHDDREQFLAGIDLILVGIGDRSDR